MLSTRRYSKPRKVKLSPFFRSTIRLLSSLIATRSFANSSRSRLSIAFTSQSLRRSASTKITIPFGFHLTADTLSSEMLQRVRSTLAVSSFRLRARLGFSIPSLLSGRRGVTPAFGYSAPHLGAGGTLTLLNNALLSAHYRPDRIPLAVHRLPGVTGYTASLLRQFLDGTRRASPVA